MTTSKQLEIAQDLVDFCGGELTVSTAKEFFIARDYNLTPEEERRVLLTALSLIQK